MRAKLDAVRHNFADFCQAENLEPAAVREDGLVPVDESVQPAGGADDVEAGTDVEMVGVAENDLCAHLDQFTLFRSLD